MPEHECGLLYKIENKRQVLIYIVAKEGLSSPQAINCSQELDHLLNCYDRLYTMNINSTNTIYVQSNYP